MKLFALSPWILQTLIWVPTRLVFKFFTGFQIEGAENIAGLKGGVIFALNHTSELDPIILPASFPFFSRLSPMMYISRERKFYKRSGWRQILYGGTFFKLWGAYPARTGLYNYEDSLKAHIKILKAGLSLCVFPEGFKTRTGFIGEGKGGVAYLAFRSGAPVVPVGINGAFQSYFRDFILRKKKIRVSFGRPIYPAELFDGTISIVISETKDDCRIAAAKIMEKISKLSGIPIGASQVLPAPARRESKQILTQKHA